jgi:hypothetical protein
VHQALKLFRGADGKPPLKIFTAAVDVNPRFSVETVP